MHHLSGTFALQQPLMIVGNLPPAGRAQVTTAYDQAVLAEVETGGKQHVDAALAVAHKTHLQHRNGLPLPERLAILERAAGIMREQADDIALLAALEGGKPLPDSVVEVTRAIDGMHICIETMRGHAGGVIPIGSTPATSGRIAFTQKVPIGVVAAVSAFNHPLNLIVHQVAPAVATGCPVIIKPAGDTPLSCLRFVSILREAGLPDEWCQALVTENTDAAEALVTDSRVAFFSFIGSAKIGWMLRSKLAPGTRCALEHGGVAPVVLGEDFDRELALGSILKGGFYHAGQVCVSVQRVYAPATIAKSFAQELADRASKLVIGDPALETTEVGPLIRPAEVTRISDWVNEAVRDGAQLLCGGNTLSATTYECTVLLDPSDNAKVSQDEIFGPVVCVYSYDDIDDAVTRANSLPVAFQAAVFSRDIDVAMKLYRGLDASAVMINDHTAFRDDVMPFAGLRSSGLGVGGIPYTIEDMQVNKMAVIKSPGLS